MGAKSYRNKRYIGGHKPPASTDEKRKLKQPPGRASQDDRPQPAFIEPARLLRF